ncbi:hypothetical protein F5B19DRAFT_490125 [Rostrohypoxylon terebratum]|nr:hypothetical protein F5B19DRAFT_490125 [Rostrohypoxylon terebratum]
MLPRTSPLPSTHIHIAATTTTIPPTLTRTLHTTPALNAKVGAVKGGGVKGGGKGSKGSQGRQTKRSKKNKGDLPDPRITNLLVSMPRRVPAPLRFARNRALRHWTIHRAWLLYQRQVREAEERQLERMHNSMYAACEELRKMSGPGPRAEGYLYRVAMEKKGVYKNGGIPIEYARAQTETPAREPWNHGWTRS